MEKGEHALPIERKKLLWMVVICSGFFIAVTRSKFTYYFINNICFKLIWGIALLFLLSAWIVVFIDIARNKIRNKIMWYLALLYLGILPVILYLIYRDAHLRAYRNLRFLKKRRVTIPYLNLSFEYS